LNGLAQSSRGQLRDLFAFYPAINVIMGFADKLCAVVELRLSGGGCLEDYLARCGLGRDLCYRQRFVVIVVYLNL